MTTLAEVLAAAMRYHQTGQLSQAEQLCRQILAVNPGQVDALHLLGVLAYQAGHGDLAIRISPRPCARSRAASRRTQSPGHCPQGTRATDGGGTVCYQNAPASTTPNFAEAAQQPRDHPRGSGGGGTGRGRHLLSPGLAKLEPDHAEIHNNLGIALAKQGKLTEAAACYRLALQRTLTMPMRITTWEMSSWNRGNPWRRRPVISATLHHLGPPTLRRTTTWETPCCREAGRGRRLLSARSPAPAIMWTRIDLGIALTCNREGWTSRPPATGGCCGLKADHASALRPGECPGGAETGRGGRCL